VERYRNAMHFNCVPCVADRREFYIVCELNGKVIDIKGGQGKPGDDLVLWSKHGVGNNKNQLWYTDPQGFIRSALNDFDINAGKLLCVFFHLRNIK